MLKFLVVIVILIAVPVVIGFITSRRGRREDRQHLSAIIGFSGAGVAVVATVAWLIGASLAISQTPRASIALQWFGVVSGLIGIGSSFVAFIAGFFSRGVQRVILVILGPVMAVIYVLGAFSNFGA